jgi:hypothetical protein
MFARNFFYKCSWSTIKSLPLRGLIKSIILTVTNDTNILIATTDIQAPDTVPSLS